MAGAIIKKCCCDEPCSDCPGCDCFVVDPTFVTIPAFEFSCTDEGDNLINCSFPEITEELSPGGCQVSMSFGPDTLTGLTCNAPGLGDATDVEVSYELRMKCELCNCVAFWHLWFEFSITGDIGFGNQVLCSGFWTAVRAIPPYTDPGGGQCDPAQTITGEYTEWYTCTTADQICPFANGLCVELALETPLVADVAQ